MKPEEIVSRLEKVGIIPVLSVESPDSVPGLAGALKAGGMPIAEVTFRTRAAPEVMRRFREEHPDMILGAGTVLSPEDAALAAECGASFLVAPGLNPAVVKEAQEIGLPIVPGIMTPSDLEAALGLGCRVLKIFPAEVAGGVRLVQALSGPYKHTGVRFVPTGGVSPSNLATYLEQPTVLAVGGTWIAKKEDIDAASWETVTRRCREALEVVARVRATAKK